MASVGMYAESPAWSVKKFTQSTAIGFPLSNPAYYSCKRNKIPCKWPYFLKFLFGQLDQLIKSLSHVVVQCIQQALGDQFQGGVGETCHLDKAGRVAEVWVGLTRSCHTLASILQTTRTCREQWQFPVCVECRQIFDDLAHATLSQSPYLVSVEVRFGLVTKSGTKNTSDSNDQMSRLLLSSPCLSLLILRQRDD